jgi:hypothetical protein
MNIADLFRNKEGGDSSIKMCENIWSRQITAQGKGRRAYPQAASGPQCQAQDHSGWCNTQTYAIGLQEAALPLSLLPARPSSWISAQVEFLFKNLEEKTPLQNTSHRLFFAQIHI